MLSVAAADEPSFESATARAALMSGEVSETMGPSSVNSSTLVRLGERASSSSSSRSRTAEDDIWLIENS